MPFCQPQFLMRRNKETQRGDSRYSVSLLLFPIRGTEELNYPHMKRDNEG